MIRTKLVLIMCVTFVLGIGQEAYAGIKIKHCSAEAARNIHEAVQFMRNNMGAMKGLDLAKRKGQRRRIRRRMDRKIDKLKFSCAQRLLCRAGAPRTALHPFGVVGKKIRLCYTKMRTLNYNFCTFTGTVAHEFGHVVGIPKKRFGRHHRERNDKVYRFGNAVRDLCYSQKQNRRLE